MHNIILYRYTYHQQNRLLNYHFCSDVKFEKFNFDRIFKNTSSKIYNLNKPIQKASLGLLQIKNIIKSYSISIN